MELLQPTAMLVKCPHCGNKFSPEEALGHDLRVEMEKEFEIKLQESIQRVQERVRKQEKDRYELHVKTLEEDRKVKVNRLHELEKQSVLLEQRERELREKEQRQEIEMKKRLLEREKAIQDQAQRDALEKVRFEYQERESKLARDREALELQWKKRTYEEAERVREEERMKNAEIQKKLDDQIRLVNEMKRKSEQGSMQMQGEVQELAIEEFLSQTFFRDEIQEVAKGKRGGDCIQIIKNDYQKVCGKILYESKRTKHFSNDWIPKIKEDMRIAQADVALLVTEALPDGVNRFAEIDGVWVCTFSDFKALAFIFRQNILRLGEVLSAQENRGDKMQLIYSYVTGNEFRQKLEASFESFKEMQDDLNREKSMLITQWAKREKRLLKAMESLVSLYGDVKGIAGGAVQEIKLLEFDENDAKGFA